MDDTERTREIFEECKAFWDSLTPIEKALARDIRLQIELADIISGEMEYNNATPGLIEYALQHRYHPWLMSEN